MGTVYVLNKSQEEVMEIVQKNLITISVVHRPFDEKGEPSRWPYGLKDESENHLWFEDSFLHCWGRNDPQYILRTLSGFGVRVVDTF
jgi:hypothetical protein